MSSERKRDSERDIREEHVLRVRLGHGANCSSVGSVVDTLFLGATLGGVVFAAICAAMKVEGITVVGGGAARGAARSGAAVVGAETNDAEAQAEEEAP